MTLYTYAIPRQMARRWMAQQQAARPASMPVNIHDENDAYVLTALVPGLKADDLTIQVLEDVVSLEGEVPEAPGEFLLQELPTGAFRRELRLPAPLDANSVEAKIADGVLTVRLPKAESARPKSIKVIAK
jgi:HSP20 family protein